jgi:hypothetical protein
MRLVAYNLSAEFRRVGPSHSIQISRQDKLRGDHTLICPCAEYFLEHDARVSRRTCVPFFVDYLMNTSPSRASQPQYLHISGVERYVAVPVGSSRMRTSLSFDLISTNSPRTKSEHRFWGRVESVLSEWERAQLRSTAALEPAPGWRLVRC